MTIIILNKDLFEKSVVTKLLNKWSDKAFFISILDPDNKESYFQDRENYKTVWFYDLEFELGDYKIFNSEIAKELVNFIDRNKDKKTCIIHCTAGVSRSGAIGEFIQRKLGTESMKTFRKRNKHIHPNRLVRKLLNIEWNKHVDK